MLGFLLAASAITLLTWLLWRVHYTKTRKVIDKLPGPPALPFIGNILEFCFLNQQGFMLLIFNYAKKYTPVYRTWNLLLPMIHVSDPSHAEVFLSSTQNIRKSKDYKFISDWLGTGLLTSSGSKWHSRRKMLTPAFHFKILEEFISIFNTNSDILVSKLRKQTECDIVPLVTLCALDIICETAMGTKVNAQRDSKSHYVSLIHEINRILMYRILRPWLYPSWIYKFSLTGIRQKKCVKMLHDFTKQVISERRLELKGTNKSKSNEEDSFGSKRKTTFLDLLLEMSEKEGGLSDEDIREEVDTFMFEGHDTTAMAMSWALFFIASNPQVQVLCYKEHTEIFQGSNREATMSDLNNMKYLERVIKETLRLRPSVYTIGRNLDTKVIMDGYEIPAKTHIQLDIVNVHRHPKHWPDPETFNPDRFLPENSQGRHPFAFIPFSAGQRNCIGQRFAMLEDKCVLSHILRNFELRAVNAERDAAMLPDLILRPEHGITLKINNRF